MIEPPQLSSMMASLFMRLNKPESLPHNVQWGIKVTMTFEQLKTWLMQELKIETDGTNDLNEEILTACLLSVHQYPHLFKFTVCLAVTSDPSRINAEISFCYNGEWVQLKCESD